jgi:hypothetical protein
MPNHDCSDAEIFEDLAGAKHLVRHLGLKHFRSSAAACRVRLRRRKALGGMERPGRQILEAYFDVRGNFIRNR